MRVSYRGNVVNIYFSIGDTPAYITLADVYSFEDIVILLNNRVSGLTDEVPIPQTSNVKLHFPPVNSRNPNTIRPRFDNTKENRLSFLITKFGQMPDPHYFDKAFDPILVTGDDGNEYNVIPSDQFK